MRAALVACCLAALAPCAARAADDPKPQGDLAKIQGRWTGKVGPEKNFPLVLVIEGTKANASFTRPDGTDVELKGKIKLDEAKAPKQMDWTGFVRPDGNAAEDNLGIYELDGDTLRVCNGGPGNDRPDKFEDGTDGPPHVILLKREKAKDAK